MKKQFIKDNKIITLGDSVVYYEQIPIYEETPESEIENPEYKPTIIGYKDGTKMIRQNPSEEFLLEQGWEEYHIEVTEPILIYEVEVESKIRSRYTVSEELAILRQRETKVEEFNEYYAYCEVAKEEFKPLKPLKPL